LKAAALFALAAALYAIAAWSVKPGFYDCCAGPTYAYVSPPPILAPGNVTPAAGSAELTDGGTVATRDQPTPQAAIQVPKGALPGPATIRITPLAPRAQAGPVTITGNVYCVTASSELNPGARVGVRLLVPPYQPLPNAIYYAPGLDGPWESLGGRFDQITYLMSATASQLGCFAVGYPTPKPSSGPRLGGALLPLVTAILISVVILAGLPLALRRRSARRG
jgi:hypothetical protein